MEVGDNILRTL